MCGIAGIIQLRGEKLNDVYASLNIPGLLQHRGLDSQRQLIFPSAQLYHSRLSIIDTSHASDQPYTGKNEKEALVYNGEIFNYKERGESIGGLESSGDTEVLFRLIKRSGKNCLDSLNGFFAFGFYDSVAHALLLVRDRYGVKPLYYYYDDKILAFASELRPLLTITGKQALDHEQLYTYFRLNYCAGKQTIFKNIFKLLPGELIEVKDGKIQISTWYKPATGGTRQGSSLFTLMDDAVKKRLHADVPLGSFLSGGLDSSIISALAIKHKPDLETFSIGFSDAGYFDETKYSEIVARHINSNHHVYKLSENDFLNNLEAFFNAVDEPFADSSAFNFYMLCREARKRVKVALSGDGADELFKGYNKHRALLLSRQPLLGRTVNVLSRFTKGGSREGKTQNLLRQIEKFKKLTGLSEKEKIEVLASISSDAEVRALLVSPAGKDHFHKLFKPSENLTTLELEDAFDLQTVLADDMLVKADRFSMRHGLEIRNPFLDHQVVEYAMRLDNKMKISLLNQKIILRETFGHLLPPEILRRPKKGFEIPLRRWLCNELRSKLEHDWLNEEKIAGEKLFNAATVAALKQKLFSESPGESAAQLWALIVFEKWRENYREFIL